MDNILHNDCSVLHVVTKGENLTYLFPGLVIDQVMSGVLLKYFKLLLQIIEDYKTLREQIIL